MGRGGSGDPITGSFVNEKPATAREILSSRSSGGTTYESQCKLPRLPIPTLEATLDKLSKYVLPALLTTDEEREEAARVIQEFKDGEGPKLQQALVDYDAKGAQDGTFGSYVEEFWNDSYLNTDASVVMNLNPFFVLEDGPDPKTAKDQLKRASSLCFASLKVASSLKDESLDPDSFKGNPLCMDQFRVLFGSSRQPGVEGGDDIHVYSDSSHGRCDYYLV